MKRIKPAPLHSKNSGLEIKNVPEFKSGKYKNKPFLWRNVAGLSALIFNISLMLCVGFISSVYLPTAQAQNIQTQAIGQISNSEYSNLINTLLSILNSLKEQLNKLQQNINSSGKINFLTPTSTSLFSLPQPVLNISQNLNKLLNRQPSAATNANTSNSAASVSISGIDDYYKKFFSVTKNMGFTDGEMKLMEKDGDGKNIFRLEQLIEQAGNGYDLNKIKDSFAAWHNFDERVIASLRTIAASGSALSLNNSFIAWLQYHSDIADTFTNGNLTASQINDLYSQFKTKAAAQNLLMKNSITGIKDSSNFSLINSADALTCTPSGNTYYFGGKISSQYYCNDGMAFVISTPCGGTISLSYAVEALNTYFKGFLKVSDYVLGKATVGAGTCMLGQVEQTVYEASMVFYGASGGV